MNYDQGVMPAYMAVVFAGAGLKNESIFLQADIICFRCPDFGVLSFHFPFEMSEGDGVSAWNLLEPENSF